MRQPATMPTVAASALPPSSMCTGVPPTVSAATVQLSDVALLTLARVLGAIALAQTQRLQGGTRAA